MCLGDNRLLSKIIYNSRRVTIDNNVAVAVAASPYRVGLIMGTGSNAGSGVRACVGTQSDIDIDGAYCISTYPLQLNYRDDGPIVGSQWFALDDIGGSDIWVAESILPAEWWPAFLGEVSIESIRGR